MIVPTQPTARFARRIRIGAALALLTVLTAGGHSAPHGASSGAASPLPRSAAPAPGAPTSSLSTVALSPRLAASSSHRAASSPAAAASAEAAPGRRIDLEFEWKLLYRGRIGWRRVEVDQWAGARLRLIGRTAPGGSTRYLLEHPLEDPWVFRWYPLRDGTKLGASLSVAHPEGDPYASLRTRLEPAFHKRRQAWWQGQDRSPPNSPWSHTAAFWSACRDPATPPPPTPRDPTYPFHVLGETRGRLGWRTDPDGVIVSGTPQQQMTEPWMANGWTRAAAGEAVVGYGFWQARRPDWRPNVYPAIVAALEGLAWSPRDGATTREPLAALRQVGRTLNPKVARRLPEARSMRVSAASADNVAEATRVYRGRLETLGRRQQSRFERRHRRGRSSTTEDTLEVLVEDGCRLRVWMSIRYRPADDSSTNPRTNAPISSRTRR